MNILVCECGNPTHSTIAAMVDCLKDSERRSAMVQWYNAVYRPLLNSLHALPGIKWH